MHRLPRKRAQPCADIEEPGEQFTAVGGRPHQFARLFGQIEQDGTRIEYPDLRAARSIGVDDGRDFSIRVYGPELGRVLLTFAGIDGYDLVGQALLFEKQGDLRGVGGRMVVQPDHPRTFREGG